MTRPRALADDVRMTAYEKQQWERLNAYWAKRADARGTPKWLADGARRVVDGVRRSGQAVGRAVPDRVKDVAGDVSDVALDKAVLPVTRAVAGAVASVLELVSDTAMELQDPEKVLAGARQRGLEVNELADLRKLDLKDCDQLLARSALKARAVGALDGAAMGALALVPVAGIPLSIGLDVLVMQVMTTAVASRVAHTYGFDAKDPVERDFIAALVTRSLGEHAARARALTETSKAFTASSGRKRWSQALRRDHRVMAALEKFMAKWYSGGHVPVSHVSKTLPVVSIVVGAGTNAHILGSVADHAQKYCQTRFLAEKYGLPLPVALTHEEADEYADGGHD